MFPIIMIPPHCQSKKLQKVCTLSRAYGPTRPRPHYKSLKCYNWLCANSTRPFLRQESNENDLRPRTTPPTTEGTRGGEFKSYNNLDIMSGNVAQHVKRRRRSRRSRRAWQGETMDPKESIALCQTAEEEMQLYGMCEPKDLHRIQVVVDAQAAGRVLCSGPHAELNAILISRNLCHNYFLIISHSARARGRISHCVCNGLKFNNKTPSSSCSASPV